MLLHDASFVDAATWWAAGNGVGVAGVDAKFAVQDGSADAGGNEGVPAFLDDGSEVVAELRFEEFGKADHFIKFGLVQASIPGDAIGAFDGEIERVGGLTENGGAAM